MCTFVQAKPSNAQPKNISRGGWCPRGRDETGTEAHVAGRKCRPRPNMLRRFPCTD